MGGRESGRRIGGGREGGGGRGRLMAETRQQCTDTSGESSWLSVDTSAFNKSVRAAILSLSFTPPTPSLPPSAPSPWRILRRRRGNMPGGSWVIFSAMEPSSVGTVLSILVVLRRAEQLMERTWLRNRWKELCCIKKHTSYLLFAACLQY